MTQLLVLGALNMKPMSGYDIQLLLQQNEAERWSGVQVGSIYHALKKLHNDGFIEIDAIEYSGNRQKAIYRITENGKEKLTVLIKNSIELSPVPYPLSVYAGLSFIDQLPIEDAKTALEAQLNMLQRELQIIEFGISEKKRYFSEELPPFINLVSNNMINILNQQIQFTKDAIKILE